MERSIQDSSDATEALAAGEYEKALRIAGPILEASPTDSRVWYVAARTLLEMGEEASGAKNLKSLIRMIMAAGRPIFALALIKEFEDLGIDMKPEVASFAELYCAESERAVDTELLPPPLPPVSAVDPWDSGLDREELVAKAKSVLAVSWGQSLNAAENESPVPYIPLLSSMGKADLIGFLGLLKRRVYAPGDPIIVQGNSGDTLFIVAGGEARVSRSTTLSSDLELALLGPGAFFGEMALVSRSPRAASVNAVYQSVLLEVKKGALEDLAERSPDVGNVLIAFCHARMLENLIRVSPVFAPIPLQRRPEVIACFGTDYREAGEVVITEGQEGEGLYVIVSGEVEVRREEGEKQKLIAHLSTGDVFGEISLVMRRPSTATVTAVEDTALLFLPRDEFNNAIGNHPELLKGVFDIALERDTQNNSILASDLASEGVVLL